MPVRCKGEKIDVRSPKRKRHNDIRMLPPSGRKKAMLGFRRKASSTTH